MMQNLPSSQDLLERDSSLVLALEMFERDVQDTLDAYLKGEIPEDEFLEQARPWPNYLEDYRPLIEFAKSKGIPVIAANIPRRAAAAVAMANKISPDVLGGTASTFQIPFISTQRNITNASWPRWKQCPIGLR